MRWTASSTRAAAADGPAMSPARSDSRCAAAAWRRWRSKIRRLRRNDAAGPAKIERSRTSLLGEPAGLVGGHQRPSTWPSDNIGTSTTDWASVSSHLSWSSRGSDCGRLLT